MGASRTFELDPTLSVCGEFNEWFSHQLTMSFGKNRRYKLYVLTSIAILLLYLFQLWYR